MRFVAIIVAYLIGSISFGYLIGKGFKNIDIRKHGSGNAGATNGLRVLGKKLGAIIFILDLLKGILAMYLGSLLFGREGMLLSGIFVVVGHNYPVFLNFKGGKGVATSIGVLLVMNPKATLVIFLIGIGIVLITRYVSLASISLSILAPFIFYLFGMRDGQGLIMVSILALMSVYQHRENIKRLVAGKENKIF